MEQTGKKLIIKRIAATALFLILVFAIIAKMSWLYRGNDYESRHTIPGFISQGDCDVVVYGASNVLRYWQPLTAYEKYGYTSYNYATVGSGVDEYRYFIEESRLHNEAKLYVVDIRAIGQLSDEVSDHVIRNWSDSLPVFNPVRWKALIAYLGSRDLTDVDVPSFFFDIMKYHSNRENLHGEDAWRHLDLKNMRNASRGYIPDMESVPYERPARPDTVGELTERQINALNDICDYADKEHLDVLFISNAYVLSDEDSEILNAAGELIESRGYKFLNTNLYYDEMNVDFETDFCDYNHMNILGSSKYTDFLSDYLHENYDLPDHRKDPAYAMWEEDAAPFASDVALWTDTIKEDVKSHKEAKALWPKIQSEENFAVWMKYIDNKNFSVAVMIKDMPRDMALDNPLYELTERYGIDLNADTYLGFNNAGEALINTSEETAATAEATVASGRAKINIDMSLDDGRLMINEEDYYDKAADIRVVIFDNNYRKVIDSVTVKAEGSYALLSHNAID